jgi:hypothetical protein
LSCTASMLAASSARNDAMESASDDCTTRPPGAFAGHVGHTHTTRLRRERGGE